MIKVFQYGVVSLLLLLVLYIAARVQNALYKPFRRVLLGDYPLWEFMAADEERRHLLVAHFNKLLVIDMDKDEIISSITGSKDMYGIALAPALAKGFICHRQDNSITVIDLQTLQTTGAIEGTGPNPESVLYDAFSHRLFVFSSRNSIVTVIDPAGEKIIATITLPYKPALAISDEKGNLFIQADNSDVLLQVDTHTYTIVQQWRPVVGEMPGGLATDPVNQLLFAAYDGRMLVLDNTTGATRATIPIGAHPGTVLFQPGTALLYCANGEGTVSVIKQNSPLAYKPVQRLSTQSGSRVMALDPIGRKLYLLGVQSLPGKKTVRGSFEVLVFGEA